MEKKGFDLKKEVRRGLGPSEEKVYIEIFVSIAQSMTTPSNVLASTPVLSPEHRAQQSADSEKKKSSPSSKQPDSISSSLIERMKKLRESLPDRSSLPDRPSLSDVRSALPSSKEILSNFTAVKKLASKQIDTLKDKAIDKVESIRKPKK